MEVPPNPTKTKETQLTLTRWGLASTRSPRDQEGKELVAYRTSDLNFVTAPNLYSMQHLETLPKPSSSLCNHCFNPFIEQPTCVSESLPDEYLEAQSVPRRCRN